MKCRYYLYSSIFLPVTPCAGVWIEMDLTVKHTVKLRSLPVRECGLKSLSSVFLSGGADVTPCAGVWIEILFLCCNPLSRESLPVRECGLKYAGCALSCFVYWSLPVRECGLKYFCTCGKRRTNGVTPCAGVWIEIAYPREVILWI